MPKTKKSKLAKQVPYGIIGRIGHKINQAIGEDNAKALKGKVLDIAGKAVRHGVTSYAKQKGYDKVVKNKLGVDIPFGMKKKRQNKKK